MKTGFRATKKRFLESCLSGNGSNQSHPNHGLASFPESEAPYTIHIIESTQAMLDGQYY
jgi:hypothetical protein